MPISHRLKNIVERLRVLDATCKLPQTSIKKPTPDTCTEVNDELDCRFVELNSPLAIPTLNHTIDLDDPATAIMLDAFEDGCKNQSTDQNQVSLHVNAPVAAACRAIGGKINDQGICIDIAESALENALMHFFIDSTTNQIAPYYVRKHRDVPILIPILLTSVDQYFARIGEKLISNTAITVTDAGKITDPPVDLEVTQYIQPINQINHITEFIVGNLTNQKHFSPQMELTRLLKSYDATAPIIQKVRDRKQNAFNEFYKRDPTSVAARALGRHIAEEEERTEEPRTDRQWRRDR